MSTKTALKKILKNIIHRNNELETAKHTEESNEVKVKQQQKHQKQKT